MHMLHSAFITGQKCTNWEFAKLPKNCYSIFKKSPRCTDYLKTNDLHELHKGTNTDYLFPLNFGWVIEIWQNLRRYCIALSLTEVSKALEVYLNMKISWD